MEGNTFVLLALDNKSGYGDVFSWAIGDLPQTVFVKVISQADSFRSSHDVWNGVGGLPSRQFFLSKRKAQLFCKVHHGTFESQAGDVAALGCREDGDESSKAGADEPDSVIASGADEV